MKTHPYLRAYMAGVTLPTVFLLFALAGLCVVRFGFNPGFPIERVVVFPLALVPAIWGAWNMLFLALHGRGWTSLGIHGAIVPLIVIPLAMGLSKLVGIDFPVSRGTLMSVAMPTAVIIYYLAWKYIVRWLNEVLGIA